MSKKKFKMPSSYVIIMGIVILVAILSWILPGGAYDYVDPTILCNAIIVGTEIAYFSVLDGAEK